MCSLVLTGAVALIYSLLWLPLQLPVSAFISDGITTHSTSESPSGEGYLSTPPCLQLTFPRPTTQLAFYIIKTDFVCIVFYSD